MSEFLPPVTAAIVTVFLTSLVAYVVFRYRNTQRVEVQIPYHYQKAEISVILTNTGFAPITVQTMGISAPLSSDNTDDFRDNRTRVLKVLRLQYLDPSWRERSIDGFAETFLSKANLYWEMMEDGEMIKLERGESVTRTANTDEIIASIQQIEHNNFLSIARNHVDGFDEPLESSLVVFPYCRLVGRKNPRWGNMVVLAKSPSTRGRWGMVANLDLYHT